MKINRRPLLAIIPAAALAGSMLTAPVAGAQSSLPTDAFGSFTGSLGSSGEEAPGECVAETEVVTPEIFEAAGWSTPGDETPAEIKALGGGAEEDPEAGPGGVFLVPGLEVSPVPRFTRR